MEWQGTAYVKSLRSKTRRERFPTGLLVMLGLVAIIEVFVARHELDVLSPDEWQYLLARRLTGRQAMGRDILILGDSQAKFGVLPKELDRGGRSHSFNLAMTGAQAPATYAVLRAAIENGAPPAAVVVDFNPFLLAKPPHTSRDGLGFLLDFRATFQLGWLSRDPVLCGELLTRQTLSSLRCRNGLRAWGAAALDGSTNRYRMLMPELLEHWAQNDGALLVPSIPGRSAGEIAQQFLVYPPGWTPDRTNADFVRLFLQLADLHGIRVYWLLPPIHPDLQAAHEIVTCDERYRDFVRDLQRRYPCLTVCDGRDSQYDPSVFLDPTHLGLEGAVAFSQDLGELIRRRERDETLGRWIKLPPYRPRATAPHMIAARLDVFFPAIAPSIRR